jgi:tetratricopeptide (TPR) repeat protein
MKSLLTLSFFFFTLSLFTQNLSLKTGTTRAVIIGISDYKHEKIPDLKFADRDAHAFSAYLQSKAGGNLPKENITILTNEKATAGQMYAAFDWLMAESKAGDKAIIYFSGHGDVERKTMAQRGFLLPYDSPPNNYHAGGFALFYLKDIIETLSIGKEAQVIMISDACRAGKLAGSNINGTQTTSILLSKQYANEIKILSCQPSEFSIEGEQWGGGRGCFSYHLTEGLYGLADKNGNGSINLLELERHLIDNVTTEADPHSQIPMTVGNKGEVISYVDQETLDDLLSHKKSNPLLAFSPIDTRGIEDVVLTNADSTIKELYDKFLVALEKGNLMEPKGECANDYFNILVKKEETSKVHGFMKRNFVAALIDESQEALMDLFYSSERYYSEYVYTEEKSVKNFAKYLERATELLGEDHYLYNSLKARQIYFSCYNLWENRDTTLADSIVGKNILDTALKGLEYDDEAAYIYWALAKSYYLEDTVKAINYFEKAIEYAPNWAMAYADFGLFYRDNLNFDKAIKYCEKAIQVDSNYFRVYQWLAYTYGTKGDWVKQREINTEASKRLEKLITSKSKADIFPYYYYQLGEAYWMLGKNQERAIEVLKIAADSIGDKELRVHTILGAVYAQNGNYIEAEKEYQIANVPSNDNRQEPLAYLAQLYQYRLRDYKKAEEYYYKCLDAQNPNNRGARSYGYYSLGNLYRLNLIDYEKAKNAYKKALELYPNNPDYLIGLGNAYFLTDSLDLAMINFEQAIDLNPNHSGAYYFIAKIHDQLKDTDKAILSVNKAIKLVPNHPYYHDFAASLYAQKGENEKAISSYKEAMNFSENPIKIGCNLGQFYIKINQLQEAESLFDSLALYDFTQSGEVYYLAKGFMSLKKMDSFESTIQKGIKKFPDDNTLFYNNACLYSLANQKGKALIQLETAFQKGYNSQDDYYHMQTDSDLDNIRDTPEFKALLEKYFPEETKK